VAYHVVIDDAVKSVPKTPANCGTISATIRRVYFIVLSVINNTAFL